MRKPSKKTICAQKRAQMRAYRAAVKAADRAEKAHKKHDKALARLNDTLSRASYSTIRSTEGGECDRD